MPLNNKIKPISNKAPAESKRIAKWKKELAEVPEYDLRMVRKQLSKNRASFSNANQSMMSSQMNESFNSLTFDHLESVPEKG